MARVLALLTFLCFAALACGGDDDTASPTSAPDDSGDASGSPSETPPGEAWSGVLSGPLAGEFTGTLAPQCVVDGDIFTVSLQGIVAGDLVVVSILSGGPGVFDMSHPADESPTVDIATNGDPPAEWFGIAGASTSGDLTLEADGSGTAAVTLPSIVAGTQPDITLTADWTCPAL
jgi:hypothetical protein